MKRFQDWKGTLSQFLAIGDQVDDEFVDYFIEVVHPATMRPDLVQMGEIYNHIDSKPTFYTLAKEGEAWNYAGLCFRGERENRIVFKPRI